MHTQSDNYSENQPWYKQFWPWFLISIPALTVLACMATIMMAIYTPNAMVVDDYTKVGLSIRQSQQRDQRAVDLGLKAILQFDPKQNTISAAISNLDQEYAALQLRLSHPTLANQDQTIQLNHRDQNHFFSTNTVSLDIQSSKLWYVQLEPSDQTWRLNGELDPNTASLTLTAKP